MASFRKRGKTWQYRIKVKVDDGFKEVTASGFATKKEAQIAAAKKELEVSRGIKGIGNNILFPDYFKQWYETYKEPNVAPRTKKLYEWIVKVAYQYFPQTKLKDLSESVYQDFINVFGSNRTKQSVKTTHTCLKSSLKRAVKKGLIPFNPADDVVLKFTKKARKERLKYLNEQEQIKLINAIENNIKNTNRFIISDYAILVSLTCGLRFGELLGIGLDSFKDDFKTLVINRAYDYKITKRLAPTKNKASNRTIALDELTRTYIKKLIIHQKKMGLTHKDFLLFIMPSGLPIDNNLVNYHIKSYCKKLGIPRITHHGLRHSHISLLLYKQVNIKYISRRVGHSNIQTTLNTYSHIIDELEQRENAKVIEIYKHLAN